MSMNRRDAVKLMGLMAAASTFSFGCTDEEARQAQQRAAASGAEGSERGGTTQPGADYERQFFTDHEHETVIVLVDLVLPADERSGSASEAGVPAFMDFVMTDELIGGPQQMRERQTAMRGGLAWLDHQCLQRFEGKPFVECSEAEQKELLDLIAYPEEAAPEMQAGADFFTSFRDLTASGFFSSKMGVEDLQYIGNRATDWNGCPDEVLEYIGVTSST